MEIFLYVAMLLFFVPNAEPKLKNNIIFTDRPPTVQLTMMGSYCSGVKVSKTHIITANHCINKDRYPTKKGFISIGGSPIVPFKIVKEFVNVAYEITQFDGYTIIKLNNPWILMPYSVVNLARELKTKEKLYVDCYPVVNGKPKHYFAKVRTFRGRTIQRGKVIVTTLPVSGGCSGGGLYNGKGELVGVTIWSHPAFGTSYFYPVFLYRKVIIKEIIR